MQEITASYFIMLENPTKHYRKSGWIFISKLSRCQTYFHLYQEVTKLVKLLPFDIIFIFDSLLVPFLRYNCIITSGAYSICLNTSSCIKYLTFYSGSLQLCNDIDNSLIQSSASEKGCLLMWPIGGTDCCRWSVLNCRPWPTYWDVLFYSGFSF